MSSLGAMGKIDETPKVGNRNVVTGLGSRSIESL